MWALACEGSYFTILTVLVADIYGMKNCNEIYGLLAIAFILGNFIQFWMVNYFVPTIGFAHLFYLFFIISIINFCVF